MRVREYPDEGLVDRVSESGHYLYCGYCLTDVGLRSCTIDAHIKTTKHLQKKRNSFLRRPDLQSIENTIKEWQNNGERMPGASLPIRELIFQFRVTRALMISGIPRARLHDDYSELKLLLEEEKFPLPHSAIDRMITPVINQERARLRSELDGLEQASIIFDGATEVGEVFSTVIRFVDEMCNIRQRLLSMSWLKQHMDSVQMAAQIYEQINKSGFPLRGIAATVRDGANVNGACTKLFEPLNPKIVDIVCVSHTCCRVGQKIYSQMSTLEAFLDDWCAMMGQSMPARHAFLKPPSVNHTKERK
jgi:hypothetical protein